MLYLTPLLSVFLLTGIVAQAIGFYLILLFIPFVIYWRNDLNREAITCLRDLSLGLFLCWFIFPLTNLYNYIMTKDIELPFKVLMKSHFSSSFLITSICLYLYSFKDKLRPKSTRSSPRFELQAPPSSTVMKPFLKGLLISSFIICAYLLYEQISGVDFLGRAIPSQRQMGTGLFRVQGFFGHPLTLAGVGLALFSFLGSLLLQKEMAQQKTLILGCLLSTAYFVFASGGRVASLLVIIFTCFILLFNYLSPKKRGSRSKNTSYIKYLYLVFSFALIFFIVYQTGLFSRFTRMYGETSSTEFERFIFWKVHWKIFLDHPIMGQGLALLNSVKRVEYYNMLGYASLENKYPAHNMILEILSNIGLFGLSVLSYGVYKIWFSFRHLSHKYQPYLRAFLVSLLINSANGLTQNVFFDSSVTYIYLSIIMLIIWGDLGDLMKAIPRHHHFTSHKLIRDDLLK